MGPSLRAPTVGDAAEIWRLARDSGGLDVNPPYTYLMACRHFSETSLVAEDDRELVGYCLAYALPTAPETIFVWQITVAVARRGAGLAGRLLDGLVERERGHVRHVEATVTPSNTASQRLFHAFAARHGATCEETVGFEADLFPAEAPHEAERLLRIGPLTSRP